MDEANHRLQQVPNQAQLRVVSVAVMVLARQSAVKAVRRQFQAQGVKLHPPSRDQRSGQRLSRQSSRANRRGKGDCPPLAG